MDPGRRSGTVMLFIAWMLIFGGAYWYFSDWESRQSNPNTASVLDRQQGDVTLERNRDGHYVAEGSINGRSVKFLLDTGATWVALPGRLAHELGLPRGAAVTLQTANGAAVGYQTRIASVRLGTLELSDVAAVTSDGLDDDTVLLGMSFLKRIEFTQRDNRLILHAPARRH